MLLRSTNFPDDVVGNDSAKRTHSGGQSQSSRNARKMKMKNLLAVLIFWKQSIIAHSQESKSQMCNKSTQRKVILEKESAEERICVGRYDHFFPIRQIEPHKDWQGIRKQTWSCYIKLGTKYTPSPTRLQLPSDMRQTKVLCGCTS